MTASRLAAVSEQRIRVIASRLPATERAGDDAGSALLLEKITDPAQLRELAKLLARCTDRHLLLAATGYLTPLVVVRSRREHGRRAAA